MSNLHKSLILLTVGLFAPATLFAATSNIGFDGLNNLILSFANGVVRSTGYMMFTLATVVFFWGIVQFIWTARQGSEGKGIQKGTQFIKWGLIAIFVMFSLWGIIRFAQGVFGIQGEDTITVPSLNFRPASGGATGGTGGTGTVTSASCAGYISNGKCYSDACPNGCTVSTGGTGGGSTGGTSGGGTGGGSWGSGTDGSGTQSTAQTAYNSCIANGNTAAECQPAYEAYGGTGSGQQNLANQAYSTCISNGNSDSACQAAYSAYGGTGTPASGGTGDNIDAGGGWNPGGTTGGSTSGGTGDDYGSCVAAGGDAYSCMQMYQTSSGSPTEEWQTSGDGTQGDYGDTTVTDSYDTESWQTTGNGFDSDATDSSLYVDQSGDLQYEYVPDCYDCA